MKLAAIYNVWDGVELLKGSIACINGHVDAIIIVWQRKSNYHEEYNPLTELDLPGIGYSLLEYTPSAVSGAQNEINKRNAGIQFARQMGCTHFLHMDCDEYWPDFGAAKREYIESGAEGSVCQLYTYFKSPRLRFESLDGYFVPFIHQLNADTVSGWHEYPFHVDPTRRTNHRDVIQLNSIMHHFSWIRKDIFRKVRNSSAKRNLERGTMLKDYLDPTIGPGSFIKDYNKRLVLIDNWANIPDFAADFSNHCMCGGIYKKQEDIIYPTSPPKFKYICSNCDAVEWRLQ